MTSDNGDVHRLHREGLSIRAIADPLGLSRMKVHRTLIAEEYDGAPDPWEDDGEDPALFDATAERWPVEPLVFCGRERQWFSRGAGHGGYWADTERWIDAEGYSLAQPHESAEMALYRYRCHVANELGEYDRADELAADWQRQRVEYDTRHGSDTSSPR